MLCSAHTGTNEGSTALYNTAVDTNRLGQHTAHLLAWHAWCRQSSDNVPSTFLLSALAMEDCPAESTGTYAPELPDRRVDFALSTYK